LLNGVRHILPNDDPVRSYSLCIGFGKGIANVVFVELTKRSNTRAAPDAKEGCANRKSDFTLFPLSPQLLDRLNASICLDGVENKKLPHNGLTAGTG